MWKCFDKAVPVLNHDFRLVDYEFWSGFLLLTAADITRLTRLLIDIITTRARTLRRGKTNPWAVTSHHKPRVTAFLQISSEIAEGSEIFCIIGKLLPKLIIT